MSEGPTARRKHALDARGVALWNRLARVIIRERVDDQAPRRMIPPWTRLTMERPGPSPPSKRSLIPVMMAAMLLLACLAVLSLLTLGFAGVIVAIVICLALVIGLQYVLWGWWLTAYLQRREAATSSSETLSRSSENTAAPDPPST